MLNLQSILDRCRSQILYECRRCGKTVEEDSERCPVCGSDDIVRYEL